MNLPLQLASFIGREREIADVRRLLTTTRLLTLTGAGGCGKTQLSLRAAEGLQAPFKDGVWLVEFAALSEPTLVPQALAAVFQVRESASLDLLEALKRHLAPKSLLLILDNCEHLIESIAGLAEDLLHACPNLRILATSREPLKIIGEMVYRVPSLTFVDPKYLPSIEIAAQYEAMRLFSERARLIQPDFALTGANLASVAQICSRLDGMPLAIELAAARLNLLNVDQIAARLDDRFQLLTRGSRSTLPRQQTLQAAVEWSHDLLTEQEKILFRRLGVFSGSFNVQAVESICGREALQRRDIVDLLGRLVDRSLVVADGAMTGGEPRCRLLETIRQYAWEKLEASGESRRRRDRHLAYFLGLGETARRHLLDANIVMWWDRLEVEHDNFRGALAWSIRSDQAEAGLRTASSLVHFWQARGYLSEATEWLQRTLAAGAEASLPARLKASLSLSFVSAMMGDFEQGKSCAQQSLEMARQIGDESGIASALGQLAEVADHQGQAQRAAELYEQSLAIFVSRQDVDGIGYARLRLADVCFRAGGLARAEVQWEEALRLFRGMGTKLRQGWALGGLGAIARLRGEYPRAVELLLESLGIYLELGYRSSVPYALEALGLIAAAMGNAAQCVRLMGAGAVLREDVHAPLPPSFHTTYAPTIESARLKLGEAGYAQAWAEGRAMTLEQAVAEAEGMGALPETRADPGPALQTFGLTTREVEVLKLLANGLTNQQIADQLVLSKRTVDAHLGSIYGKLQVTTRSAATRAAMEHKLV